MIETIYLRNRRSGKVHLAAVIGDSPATHEEDNLDEVHSHLDRLDFLPDDAELCGHCFPNGRPEAESEPLPEAPATD